MTILNELRILPSAEAFFERLDVAYDPARLRVARLHILRRMGEYLRGAELDDQPEDAIYTACRNALEQAYTDFVNSTPLEERVFKVLKDAVAADKEACAPKPAFVPLTSLSVSGAL